MKQLHHLVIPRAVARLLPGQAIHAERDGQIVGETYMATTGACAVLMISCGPVTLLFGDGRRPRRLVGEMPSRDAYVTSEGRVARATEHWVEYLRVREMSHEQRVEHERARRATS